MSKTYKLADEIGKIFVTDLKEVMDKEEKEAEYLPQCDFDTCYDRAAAGIDAAAERAKKTLALSIAKHREEKHGDDTLDEQSMLMEKGADVEVATMSYWNM